MMVFTDDALDEVDILMIFLRLGTTILTLVTLVFVKTTFCQNVVVDEQPSSFPPALHVTNVCTISPSFSFSDLRLSLLKKQFWHPLQDQLN